MVTNIYEYSLCEKHSSNHFTYLFHLIFTLWVSHVLSSLPFNQGRNWGTGNTTDWVVFTASKDHS